VGVAAGVIEMYRLRMDQLAKDDITAAAAAHQELGPHFDGAVAESLVERIGAEIDKRVDARLGERGDRRSRTRRLPASREPSPALQSWPSVVLALGSMGIGVGATAAVLNLSRDTTVNGATSNAIGSSQIVLAVLIWLVIGVINVAYARRR
jgi:hypothetical protein